MVDSRTHPLAHKEEVSIAELVEYPKIDYDKRTSSNGEYTNIRTKMPVFAALQKSFCWHFV